MDFDENLADEMLNEMREDSCKSWNGIKRMLESNYSAKPAESNPSIYKLLIPFDDPDANTTLYVHFDKILYVTLQTMLWSDVSESLPPQVLYTTLTHHKNVGGLIIEKDALYYYTRFPINKMKPIIFDWTLGEFAKAAWFLNVYLAAEMG